MAIHDRMPAIIPPEHFEAWLSAETGVAAAERLLRPAPEELLTSTPVSTRVNAVANDDPGLLEEASPAVDLQPQSEPRQMRLL